MTSLVRTQVAAAVFGLLMVGSAAVASQGPALVAVFTALLAVGLGTAIRAAATIAVLISAALIVASDPGPVFAALSGLYATAYLVSRHAAGAHVGVVLGNWPTIVGPLGFAVVGLVATSFPLQLPWLPLAAPLVVLAIYVLATRPFVNQP